MNIAVIGAAFVDYKGFPNGKYLPMGRNAGRVEIVHGGVARNVAEDIANVGQGSIFVSIVDDNALGDEVLNRLRKRGVNTDYILRRPNAMGVWLAVFDEQGELAGSISKRPEVDEIARLLDERGDEIFALADSVVFELDIEEPTLQRILALAKKHGKCLYSLVSNMSIAAERKQYLKEIDCFVCNELEAGMLFNTDFSTLSQDELCDKLSACVIAESIPAMVLTLGSRGSAYADIYGYKGFCPADKVVVTDTTGAGDAFGAGLTIGLTRDKCISRSLCIGTHLAAAVLRVSDSVCPSLSPSELKWCIGDEE